jgi:hypothetical protein
MRARSQQNNAIRWAVDDHRKILRYIAPQNAYIEQFSVATSHEFTAKDNRSIVVARHANLSSDCNGCCQSTDAANLTAGLRPTESQHH